MPAKAAKWQAGVGALWVGARLMPHFRVVYVFPDKALRAVLGIREILHGRVAVSEYRRIVSFLQSLVLIVGRGAYRMRGLWRPLQSDQEMSGVTVLRGRVRTSKRVLVLRLSAVRRHVYTVEK
eukprot:2565706-Pleurochrysis_carterae.AAC.2